MKSNPAIALITVGLATLGACVLRPGVKPYVAPKLTGLAASRVRLFSAARAHMVEKGWRITKQDERLGLVQAVTPEAAAPGVTTRERWTIWVADQEISAALRLEARWDGAGDHWQSSANVCGEYEYLRERTLLTEIATGLSVELVTLFPRTTAKSRRRDVWWLHADGKVTTDLLLH